MNISSKKYIPGDKKGIVTYRISKTLMNDISAEDALRNAEAGIKNRLTHLEIRRRSNEMNLGLANYNKRQGVLGIPRRVGDYANLDKATLDNIEMQLSEKEEPAQQALIRAGMDFRIDPEAMQRAMEQIAAKKGQKAA